MESSSLLRWKRWTSSVPQPANSFAVWVTEFLATQARLERHVFSSRESRCCCSVSTLSYSTTACRRQTALSEYRTHLLVFFSFFSQTIRELYRGLKNNNIIILPTSTKPRAWKLSKVLNKSCNSFSFGVHCIEEGDRFAPLQSYGQALKQKKLFLWCPVQLTIIIIIIERVWFVWHRLHT